MASCNPVLTLDETTSNLKNTLPKIDELYDHHIGTIDTPDGSYWRFHEKGDSRLTDICAVLHDKEGTARKIFRARTLSETPEDDQNRVYQTARGLTNVSGKGYLMENFEKIAQGAAALLLLLGGTYFIGDALTLNDNTLTMDLGNVLVGGASYGVSFTLMKQIMNPSSQFLEKKSKRKSDNLPMVAHMYKYGNEAIVSIDGSYERLMNQRKDEKETLLHQRFSKSVTPITREEFSSIY